jgi:hypothetical protein
MGGIFHFIPVIFAYRYPIPESPINNDDDMRAYR